MTPAPLPAPDLEAVLDLSRDDLLTLKGGRVLVTGGSGFVGTWLLESLLWANKRLGLAATAAVVTRDRALFERTRRMLSPLMTSR